jgi:cyclohexanecarboxylate-CoA ligase
MTERTPQGYRIRGWWRDRTFLDDLWAATGRHPDKTAVVTHRGESGHCTSLSYAELARLADRCAAALIELDMEPGDVLAVQLSNRWELAPLALGCARAGVRICILLPVYQRRELEVMLAVSRARVLITMTESGGYPLGELGMELAGQLPALEHVLIADGPAAAGADGPAAAGADGPAAAGADGPAAESFESFFFGTAWEERQDLAATYELGPDDPFLILFTSGTTGEPKAAVHSQNTLHAAIRGEADVFGLAASDKVMTTASYTHYTGFVQGMMMPLMLGGTMVFHELSSAAPVLELMSSHGVTFLYAAPWFLRNLIDEQRANPRPLPELRWLVSGSAPVPPRLVTETREVFGLRLFSLWGMSENGPVTITRTGDPDDWAAHSDGSPISDMEYRITPVGRPEDDSGVLWVRGPTQCLGYYRRDDLYARYIDDEGWFNTGDLVRPDGRGGIRVTGRARDVIIHHAFMVPVTEMEALLERHSAVRQASVIGLAVGQGEEETICAVVVPDGQAPTLAELHDQLRDAGMMQLFWPERLEIVDALPMTATGKVRKVQLQQRFALP